VEFHEILKRRKSVRAFQQRPIPGDALDRILASARYAPSAGFTQGNEYLVLDMPDTVGEFWSLIDDPDEPMTPDQRAILAPVVILPLANRQAYLDRYSQPDKIAAGMDKAERWPAPYWDIDAGMAAMLMLLAAIDEGLAAYFFGMAYGEHAVRQRFAIPSEFKPIGAIALGYAAAVDPNAALSSTRRRQRRPIESLVHRNGWQNR
jgi:nitroreductase